MILVTYKICVNRLLILSARLPVSSRHLVMKFSESQKLHLDFWLCRGLAPLPPASFKGSCILKVEPRVLEGELVFAGVVEGTRTDSWTGWTKVP